MVCTGARTCLDSFYVGGRAPHEVVAILAPLVQESTTQREQAGSVKEKLVRTATVTSMYREK